MWGNTNFFIDVKKSLVKHFYDQIWTFKEDASLVFNYDDPVSSNFFYRTLLGEEVKRPALYVDIPTSDNVDGALVLRAELVFVGKNMEDGSVNPEIYFDRVRYEIMRTAIDYHVLSLKDWRDNDSPVDVDVAEIRFTGDARETQENDKDQNRLVTTLDIIIGG